MLMALDSNVWGPHYWFFLHTIALTYPHNPNEVVKKKYYDFIQNLHLFIPVEKIGNEFTKLLTEYPLAPYLDSRDSLVRWMHFIHNKINEKLEKRKISLADFYTDYYENYKPKHVKLKEYYKLKEKVVYVGLLCGIGVGIYYMY